MRIEIDVCVANDSDAHEWLDRILHKISDGWHLWDTTRESDPYAFESTTWVTQGRGEGDNIRELLRKSVERDAWDSGLHNRRIRVTTRPANEDELCPEDAARFAEMPLWILVENRFSDGPFVKRIVEEFDRPLFRLWDQPGEPIKIDGVGGGGQMPEMLQDRIDATPCRPRLVAITDSDKKYPSDRESKAARKLRGECAEHQVPCWVLAKRAAENYLPQILLEAWKPNYGGYAQLIGAWNRLSESQKDFYNMKKGLPENRDDSKNWLFEEVSEADCKILTKGFGRNIYECWECSETNVKSQLRTRSQGDLERGIDLIRKEV